jgi:hypothetical protein
MDDGEPIGSRRKIMELHRISQEENGRMRANYWNFERKPAQIFHFITDNAMLYG